MPNLVDAPPGSGLSAELIAQAEALVAARLRVESLALTENIGQSGEINSSGLISLNRPAVSIQTLFIAGTQVPTPTLLNARTIDAARWVRPYLTGGLSGLTYARLDYAVTYTGGWDAATLPAAIREAVLATALHLASVPAGVASESMGPVSRSYVQTTGSIPGAAELLLGAYLPLRF